MSKLPNFPVRKNPDLHELNERVLHKWQQEGTFARSIEHRAGAKSWVFYEGPPSANGVPGIHHVMGRALKDLYCRYRTQRGYLVERRAGWDTHGLPVELNVEKALGITKEDIGKTVSIASYNAECKQSVMRYSDQWRSLTERIGYWVDLDHPYVTYDSKYMESVWWLLKQLHAGGHLYRGYTIQPFSPMAGSGLSTHELNQPGAYREVTDLSATVMFRLASEQEQRKRCERAGTPPAAAAFEKLRGAGITPEQVHVLAWTTTPWTLPSNTALAVNAAYEYRLLQVHSRYAEQDDYVIAAAGLLRELFPEAEYEERSEKDGLESRKGRLGFRSVLSFTGEELVGLWYQQLLPWAEPAETPEQAFRVIAGDFVSLEDGTGVVHIAPTFGADDARVAKQAGVPAMRVLDAAGELVPLVDERGRFVRGLKDGRNLSGRFVKAGYYSTSTGATEPAPQHSVDEEIVILLKQAGLLFRSLKYKHNYPHCWRTDAPIIYYPLKSWFIRTTAFKQELIENNRKIRWFPPSTGEGRFGEWLEKLADWNLSRSRFWGIPLPLWVTEDGSEAKCIGSFAELKAEIHRAIEHGVMSEDPFADFEPENYARENYDKIDVHRPYVDEIRLVSSKGQVMTREPDVIDVWFDSGAMPYAQVHYPFENREAIDSGRAYPADFIAEGVDQTRGWFFTLHAISTMVFGGVAYRNVLSNGLLVDAEGRKMSKRLGNVVDPIELVDTFGADPVRWYMITNSPPWLNLRFDREGVEEVVRKFYGTLWSTYSFFATYANADGFTGSEPLVAVERRSTLDRWILSELAVTLQTAVESLDGFDGTRAYRALQSFVIDSLSNWYVRLNRRRFWKAEMGEDKLSAYQTLYECLHSVCRALAPVSPFHAEQLYGDLTTRRPELSSVHLTDFPAAEPAHIDERLNLQMATARKVVSLTLSLRKDKGLKVRQPLSRLTVVAEPRLLEVLEDVRPLIAEEVNVKAVELGGEAAEGIQRSAQLDFRKAGPRFGKQTQQVGGLVKQLGEEQLKTLQSGQSLELALGEQTIELPPELLKIQMRGQPGAELASDGALTVLLDTELSEELRVEGFARELVSSIQRLRKAEDFEVTTRIVLRMSRHPEVDAALSAHQAYICAETLCEKVVVEPLSDVEPTNVAGQQVRMSVQAV